MGGIGPSYGEDWAVRADVQGVGGGFVIGDGDDVNAFAQGGG